VNGQKQQNRENNQYKNWNISQVLI
jgi:hypothetical protein